MAPKAHEKAGSHVDSIGAHLLRIRDAAGQKLPDEQLLPHIGMFFFAGFDTTGHTMAWTLCAPRPPLLPLLLLHHPVLTSQNRIFGSK